MKKLVTTFVGAAVVAATLATASIAFSSGAYAQKPQWICNPRGCIRCWDDLDGSHCKVVLK